MTLSGELKAKRTTQIMAVLIPLLVDDPLWDMEKSNQMAGVMVLIPLLVDDPLWVKMVYLKVQCYSRS